MNTKFHVRVSRFEFSPNNNAFLVDRSSNIFKLGQTFRYARERRKFSNFPSSFHIFTNISEMNSSVEQEIPFKPGQTKETPLEFAASPVYEATGTKCNSVYRYVQAQHDSLDWNTLPRWGGGSPPPFPPPRWIINFVSKTSFPPSADFPDQLSMKKRVSSAAGSRDGRLLEDS